MEISRRIQDPPYGWRSAFSLTVSELAVRITLRVQLLPQPGTGREALAKLRSEVAAGFARHFDRRYCIRTPGFRRVLWAQVCWDAPQPHLEARVYPGTGTETLDTWMLGLPALAHVHELAHLLGLPDEYARPDSPAAPSGDYSLMGHYPREDARRADSKPRHILRLADSLAPWIGAPATVEPLNWYVLREGDTLERIALRICGEGHRWAELLELNQDRIPDRFSTKPGQVIRLF